LQYFGDGYYKIGENDKKQSYLSWITVLFSNSFSHDISHIQVLNKFLNRICIICKCSNIVILVSNWLNYIEKKISSGLCRLFRVFLRKSQNYKKNILKLSHLFFSKYTCF
jgi:hypothetical protein